MIKRRFISISLCLFLLAPLHSFAQSGVKLFSSPQVRAELERRRLGLVDPTPTPTPIDIIANLIEPEEVEDVVFSLEGTLLKQDGTSILWINGVAVNESDLPQNIEVMQPPSLGRVKIIADRSEFVIKPGQILNATTGTIYESYEWEQIEAQRLLEIARESMEAGDTASIAGPSSDSL